MSDVSAEVCSVFGGQNETRECPSTNTGAIVGTVIALVVVLIIVAIAVATLLIVRNHRGKFSLRNADE